MSELANVLIGTYSRVINGMCGTHIYHQLPEVRIQSDAGHAQRHSGNGGSAPRFLLENLFTIQDHTFRLFCAFIFDSDSFDLLMRKMRACANPPVRHESPDGASARPGHLFG